MRARREECSQRKIAAAAGPIVSVCLSVGYSFLIYVSGWCARDKFNLSTILLSRLHSVTTRRACVRGGRRSIVVKFADFIGARSTTIIVYLFILTWL